MVDAVRRAVVGDIGQVDVASLLLARDQSLPGVTAFTDDLLGVLLVLAFTAESELVLGLAVGDLVDAEPLVRCSQEARQVTFNILNVIELGSERVVDVDDDDLPVGLFFIQQRHHAQNFDLLDLPGVANKLTNLAHVEWVVVTFRFGLGVDDIGVFPGLDPISIASSTPF